MLALITHHTRCSALSFKDISMIQHCYGDECVDAGVLRFAVGALGCQGVGRGGLNLEDADGNPIKPAQVGPPPQRRYDPLKGRSGAFLQDSEARLIAPAQSNRPPALVGLSKRDGGKSDGDWKVDEGRDSCRKPAEETQIGSSGVGQQKTQFILVPRPTSTKVVLDTKTATLGKKLIN